MGNKSTLAPVCVIVYDRVEKFIGSISALKKCDLAKESILYVLSDGAKQGDENKVKAVREYAYAIDGFYDVIVIESKTNSFSSFLRSSGLKILSDHGKIIVLEDDVVVGKGFLKFINNGLDKYRENKDIFSICGYTPPVNLEEVYTKDIYFINRFNAWGYGIWEDRFKIAISESHSGLLQNILNDDDAQLRLRQEGEDVLNMAQLNAAGKIDASDVTIMCHNAFYNKYVVAPTISLTNNIGHDGTGVHCGVTDKFDVTIDDSGKDLDLPDYIEENEFVKQKLYAFRSNIPDYRSVTRGKVPNSPFFPQQDINLNDQSKIDDRLMFLVSLPRSGSTLTQRVISSHNDVYSLPEPWNMLHVLYALKNGGIETEFEHVTAKEALHGFLDSIGGDEHFYKAVRCYSDYLYSQAFKNTNKRYYLDKTPRYFYILNELLYIYPNAKYVLLLRNPLSILSSVLKTWFDNDASKLEGTSHLRDLLQGPKLLLQCIARYPDKIKVVRYENLVNSPEESFSELFDYLGLGFDKNILNYQDSNFKKSNFGDQVNVDGHKKPVNCYVDNWKDYFNEHSSVDFALSYLEDLGSNVINDLGYDFDYLKSSLVNSKSSCEKAIDEQTKIANTFQSLVKEYEIDSENKDTVINLSKVLKNMGQTSESQQVLANYLCVHPEDEQIKNLLSNQANNTNTCLVSVIVSTYASESFIQECLEDLVGQTIFEKMEIIIVDANSPEDERSIVESFQKTHPNIKYIRTSTRIGVYAAWNIAIKEAKGEFITPMSTNDRLRNDAYEILLKGFNGISDDVMLVYGDSKLTPNPHETFYKHTNGGAFVWPEYSFEDLLVNNRVGPHPMWRKKVHEKIGYFDETYLAIGDQEFWLRIGEKFNLKHIEEFTGLFWWTENSLSGNQEVSDFEINKIRIKFKERYLQSKQINTVNENPDNLFSFKSSNKIAVILHLFYIDLWEEYELSLAGISQEFDLYISIHEGKTKDILSTILKKFPDAKIYEFPNKGRDILPFLTIFKEIQPLNYKLILKLHTKKSPHLKGYKGIDDFGEKWRKTTLNSLAQWNKRVNDIFDLFDSNPTLGIFSPFEHLYPCNSTDANFQLINQLVPGIDDDSFNKNQFVYAGGSMFWFRPEAIEGILKLNFTSDDFEDESGQIDGTVAHAIERLFGVVCKTSGYILTDRMPKRDDIAYQGWLEEKREHDLSRDLLFLSDNSIKPVIHCLIYIESEDLSLLANTIDSMGSQTYELWHLSIISTFPCPEEMFNEVAQLSWLQIDQQFDIQQLLLEIGVQADWIGFIEAGDYLESHALSSCVEYFNKHSEWQVVYTDEDKISPEGFFHSPQFKPDFNLDLLYSTDYLGGLTLFRIEFLGEMGVINYPNPFAVYDVVLHYLEYFGEAVIGHVENILMHRNDNLEQFFLAQLEFKEAALVSHFKRIKSNSLISKGLVEGSFVVKHQFKGEPKVSIIIPTKDQLSLLKACIDSILDKTSYLNYEVIIIDNQSVEEETKSYFDELSLSNPDNIRVIEYAKPYNFSAINNFAAKQAKGDYLVLLNNDTMVLQEEWLHGMLSQAQRSDVGIVGVKLVFPNKHIQHAGVVLGMGGNGVAEHPHIGIPMASAGYMGRAMVTQNVSAVTAACLMIKKDIYQQVGGLDEEKFKILYNDVDLCLKVREQGYKIVWTPYVTLIHHGSSSLKKVKQDKKKLEQSQQEVDNMLEKWLPQLANDPAYNRNLSLKTTNFQVDTSMNVTWNVDFKDRPRIYAFPTDSQGVGQYRVRGPLKALTQMGKVEASLANNLDKLVFPTPVEIERIKPDILLIQNGFLDHMLTAWKRYRKFNDVFMVCGQDDVVYMLPDNHPRKGEWPKNIRRKVKEQFQLSDRLIVANEALAEEFKKMADEIVVVPNYLENVRWDSLILPENNKGKKLRVGWAGGQEHIGDLQFILPVVKALHKEVDWVFMGLCIEELRPYVKEIHQGVDFDFYPQRLADLNLDLAIAPLMHNKFNECKTNLRLLEYGVLGWPVVCSDVLPYQNAPVTRVANNAQYWIKTIREKINEPDTLFKEGRMLQQWVVDNYMLDDHADEWYAALMP